ncbi:HNH endonuclease [Pseudonocardia sp. HH130630-07]|uniref:HNH endonuclease n=1 Tax=Pseudonocardia sp. HH130630-07 TaxID=1690815 RepID=UPI000814F890|nr:HNH endonuclease signature motif containing protein [Pseudonocardia sp. HH130630-07]ANY05709.1 hypothetical protein AFB00_04635 [Pseudonocardia sp. HH130630-07]
MAVRDEPVGHALASRCEAAGAEPGDLTDTEVLDVVAGAERLVRWASALRARMLGEFAARHPPGSRAAPPDADPRAVTDVSRWLPDQVALVLGVSREEARGLLAEAQRFRGVLPATLAAWEAGRLPGRTAVAIASATVVLDDPAARAVEARVLPAATDGIPYRLVRERLRRAIARVDPDGATRRHRRAAADRRMSISRAEEGMAALWLGGTAAQAEASWRCVDRLARSLPGTDPRTLDQRRVDLAHQLLQGTMTLTDLDVVRAATDTVLAATATITGGGPASPAPAGPTGHAGADAAAGADAVLAAVRTVLAAKPDPTSAIGRIPLIHVVVGLDTLLGADTPAELTGHGPVPATTARALAAGGTWKRLVTDPLTGTCLDLGRTTYRPPDALADLVHARDHTCRGPSCPKPVRDLDHHIPWARGGTTSADNLHGLCRGHHKLKDAPGWQVVATPDGGLTWISPCGWSETTFPEDYRRFTGRVPSAPGSGATTGPTTDAAAARAARADGAAGAARADGVAEGGSDEPPF